MQLINNSISFQQIISENLLYNDNQNKLYDYLFKEDQQCASLYKDAILIFNQKNLSFRISSSAHLMREMMKKLSKDSNSVLDAKNIIENYKIYKENLINRYSIIKVDRLLKNIFTSIETYIKKQDENKKRTEKVDDLLTRLHNTNAILSKEIRDITFNLYWKETFDKFNKFAHLSKIDDDKYDTLFHDFEKFLLNFFYHPTFEIQKNILQKIRSSESCKKTTNELKSILTDIFNDIRNEHKLSVVYSNLNCPDWLDALIELKQFATPPNTERETKILRFKHWPQVEYLEKIANLCPEKIMDLILNIQTDNPLIFQKLLGCTLLMPSNIAVKVSEKVIRWLNTDTSTYGQFLEICAKYIVYIYNDDKNKSNIIIINFLNNYINNFQNGSEYFLQEHLKIIENAFIDKEKIELIKILKDTLYKIYNGKDSFSDRPSIEQSSKNWDTNITSILMDFTRDLSEKFITDYPDCLIGVIHLFSEDKSCLPLFYRFALHLTRFSKCKEAAKNLLLNDSIFGNMNAWHEYTLLLKSEYPNLPYEQKKKLLSMIYNFIHPYNRDKNEFINYDLNESTKSKYYYIIKEFLDDEEKRLFMNLEAKYNESENPYFLSYYTSWSGSKSPKSYEELIQMSFGDIKNFIETWKPNESNEFYGKDSIEGLGIVIEKIVINRTDEFIENISDLKITHACYIYHIINGIYYCKNKNNLNWDKILNYIKLVLNSDLTGNIIWNKSIIQILTILIEEGLSSDSCIIPFNLRDIVWEIIISIIPNYDTKKDQFDKNGLHLGALFRTDNLNLENKNRVNEQKQYSKLYNEISFISLKLTILYGLWVKNNLEFNSSSLAFEKCPEIFIKLKNDLSEISKNPELLFVYGYFTPCIFHLNKAWFEDNFLLIFHHEKEKIDYWNLSFVGYIFSKYKYIIMTSNEFKKLYLLSIERLENFNKSQVEIILDDVLYLYLYDKIEITSDLIKNMYLKINENTDFRSHVIHSLLRYLNQDKGKNENEINLRVKDFFEFRLTECKEYKDIQMRKELVNFGYWIGTPKFSEEWFLKKSEEVIDLCQNISSIINVIEFLTNLNMRYPEKIIIIFEKLIHIICNHARDKGSLLFYSYELQKATPLVSDLISNSITKMRIIDIIHKLGNFGYHGFKNLLPNE